MQDVIKALFDYSKSHHEESEAVIRIALIIMHCDENITNDEVKLLDRIIFITRFDKDTRLAEFVAKSRLEILKHSQSMEDMKAFIDICVQQIKTPVIAESLVRMSELIAQSDHDYCEKEHEMISYLAESIARHH